MEIELQRLRASPVNANRMAPPLLEKLAAHIRRTGRYPALIVRPDPKEAGFFEILDGHHRAEVLRRLGKTTARCDVWNVDDDEAVILLATLNRLQGRDDLAKRAELLATLAKRFGAGEATKLTPEDGERLARILESRLPAPPPANPSAAASLPVSVTFFLSREQARRLDDRLSQFDGTRSQRLAALLHLNESPNLPRSASADEERAA